MFEGTVLRLLVDLGNPVLAAGAHEEDLRLLTAHERA
jgi:hypothetical protein